jgi:hypothetical protein
LKRDIASALDAPADNQHIVLLYNEERNRHKAVARFINEGLKRGQLCVYGSISYRDKDHLDGIKSLISGHEDHQKQGNLLFIDLAPIYIAAMQGNLGPFEQARDQLVQIAEKRNDKHIRFVGDCAGFLFKNKHFEECLMVEGWGQQKPFFGSYLCPYNKQFLDKHPYHAHKRSLLSVKHDLVVDAEEMRIIDSEEQVKPVNSSDSQDDAGSLGGLK